MRAQRVKRKVARRWKRKSGVKMMFPRTRKLRTMKRRKTVKAKIELERRSVKLYLVSGRLDTKVRFLVVVLLKLALIKQVM